eukprot:5815409-Prorocentrum_lima.AAC.1
MGATDPSAPFRPSSASLPAGFGGWHSLLGGAEKLPALPGGVDGVSCTQLVRVGGGPPPGADRHDHARPHQRFR